MTIVAILLAAVAAALVLYLAATTKESWLLILLLFMPVRDFSLGRLFGGGSLKIGDVFIAFIFLLWLAHDVILKRTSRLVTSNLDAAILLFIAFYAVALAWSLNPDLGLVRVVKFLRNFALYVVIREIFTRDFVGSCRKMAAAYFLTAAAIAVVYVRSIGLANFASLLSLTGKSSIASTDLLYIRAIPTGGGVLINGPQIWLTLAACLVFGSLLLSPSIVLRAAKILAIGVFLFLAVSTLNRSVIGLIAVAAAVFVAGAWLLGIKNVRKWIAVACLIVLAGGVALRLPQIFVKRFTNVSHDLSWLERGTLAKSAFDAFLHSPIIGIGPGSNKTWQGAFPLDPSRLADNLYLTVLSEGGLVAFGLLLAMIYYWLKYLIGGLRREDVALPLKNMLLGVLAFSVGFLFIALAGQEIESLEPWIMMGVAAAVKARYFPRAGREPRPPLEGAGA